MNSKGKRLLYAFISVYALMALLIAFKFFKDMELSAQIDKEQVTFERSMADNSMEFIRVVFALNDLLVFSSHSLGNGGREKTIELCQTLINHSKIPTLIDPSFLTNLLDDDPLFLAERVAQANEHYRSRTENLAILLDRKANEETLRAINSEALLFMEDLREYSRLTIQVESAYYAANHKNLRHLSVHIKQNLVLMVVLTILITLISLLFVRSRLAAEDELESHRDHLAELVGRRTNELSMANESLQEALKEKDVLIKEVYHRVKNNLTMVAGLVSLQQSYTNAENLERSFESLSERLQAISLIHEKLYHSADLSSIRFGEYISELVGSLKFSLCQDPESIILDFDIPEIRFSPDHHSPGPVIAEQQNSTCLCTVCVPVGRLD
ncbi:hypothetical protein MASR2M78_35240 [Treponema sp.]